MNVQSQVTWVYFLVGPYSFKQESFKGNEQILGVNFIFSVFMILYESPNHKTFQLLCDMTMLLIRII